jgi:hypothetical protein
VPDLHGLARQFAQTIQDLLNATVCDGPTLQAMVLPVASREVLVGHGLSKDSVETGRIPVRLGRGKVRCWLEVSFRLCLDAEGQYLTVVSSFFGVYAADDEQSCLCHFDYERDKPSQPGGYPEAHVQVFGKSAALAELGGRAQDRGLERLHFPVGGRRYRTTLEDVIEFLVTEKLAPGRPGWSTAVADSRQTFHRLQLRAAIRRDPEIARQMVKELGLAAPVRPARGSERPARRRHGHC